MCKYNIKKKRLIDKEFGWESNFFNVNFDVLNLFMILYIFGGKMFFV